MNIIKSRYLKLVSKLNKNQLVSEARLLGIFLPVKLGRTQMIEKILSVQQTIMAKRIAQVDVATTTNNRLPSIYKEDVQVKPIYPKDIQELDNLIKKSYCNLYSHLSREHDLRINKQSKGLEKIEDQMNEFTQQSKDNKMKNLEAQTKFKLQNIPNLSIYKTSAANLLFATQEEIWVHPSRRGQTYQKSRRQIIQELFIDSEKKILKWQGSKGAFPYFSKDPLEETTQLLIQHGKKKQEQFYYESIDPMEDLLYNQQSDYRQNKELTIKMLNLISERQGYYKTLIENLTVDKLFQLIKNIQFVLPNISVSQTNKEYITMLVVQSIYANLQKIFSRVQCECTEKIVEIYIWVFKSLHRYRQYAEKYILLSPQALVFFKSLILWKQLRVQIFANLTKSTLFNQQFFKILKNHKSQMSTQFMNSESLLEQLQTSLSQKFSLTIEPIILDGQLKTSERLELLRTIIHFTALEQRSITLPSLEKIITLTNEIIQDNSLINSNQIFIPLTSILKDDNTFWTDIVKILFHNKKASLTIDTTLHYLWKRTINLHKEITEESIKEVIFLANVIVRYKSGSFIFAEQEQKKKLYELLIKCIDFILNLTNISLYRSRQLAHFINDELVIFLSQEKKAQVIKKLKLMSKTG